jgi:hypothetical protein
VRRIAPRPLSTALEGVVGSAAPPGLLARVQAAWPAAAGPAVAEVTAPVSEREGTITIACESAVWAQELELMRGDLEARLDARLRFVVRGV